MRVKWEKMLKILLPTALILLLLIPISKTTPNIRNKFVFLSCHKHKHLHIHFIVTKF